MNLEHYGVTEMTTREMETTIGGFLLGALLSGLFYGSIIAFIVWSTKED